MLFLLLILIYKKIKIIPNNSKNHKYKLLNLPNNNSNCLNNNNSNNNLNNNSSNNSNNNLHNNSNNKNLKYSNKNKSRSKILNHIKNSKNQLLNKIIK